MTDTKTLYAVPTPGELAEPDAVLQAAESLPSSPSLGNVNAMKTGARSARVLAGLMPEQAEGLAALGERVKSIERDLGGVESLSVIAIGMIERHARLELVDDYLFGNLQRLGPLTARGRTRAALTAWLMVVDRLQKSATTLGIERRVKPIDPLIAVRAAVEEANRR
jgi:hypothetical protein